MQPLSMRSFTHSISPDRSRLERRRVQPPRSVQVRAEKLFHARQLKAGAILERLAARLPHPGVTHYLIHTYDYGPLAERGLAAARRYAAIAPASGHALHMPSHIFSTLGLWKEAIPADLAAIASYTGISGKWTRTWLVSRL
jgi:hypothetical protein